MPSHMHFVVVGGGITGLTIAWELNRRGHQVTLIERSGIGGLAGGFPYPGKPETFLERFYHHIFTSDELIQQLIEQMGLAQGLIWRPTLSGLVAEGKLWPMRGPTDLLRFKPVGGLLSRLRLGWALFRLRQTKKWENLDRLTCREFFVGHGATQGYERMWSPLLRAKFADFAEEASAAFLWGRVVPRAGSRHKHREHLGYLRGGFQKLFRAMGDALIPAGVRMILGQPVNRVIPGKNCQVVIGEETISCDRVVWTASLSLLARVLDSEAAEPIRRQLPKIPYMAVTVLILALSEPLSEYYWLNNIDPTVSFGAVIEHTNLAPPEDYGGEHIVYVVNYHLQEDSRFLSKSTEELLQYHEPSLERIFSRYSRAKIRRLFLSQDLFASPVYRVGFKSLMPPQRGLVPGVDICNMAQVYPYDRNMNHCVQNAVEYVRTYFGSG